MQIITVKSHHDNDHDSCDTDIYHGSPDADYMRHCHEVDMSPPETWSKYDTETPAGIKKVIEMEYKELMTATTDKDVETNIYHLSVALLRLWRMHNDRKQH